MAKNNNKLYLGLAAVAIGLMMAFKGKGSTTPTGNTATPQNPQPNTTAKPLDTTLVLKNGSTGAEVKKLQQYLNVSADGIFGPKTEAALKAAINKISTSLDGYLIAIKDIETLKTTAAQKQQVAAKYHVGKDLTAAVDFQATFLVKRNGIWVDTDKYGNPLGFVQFKKGAEIGYVNEILDYTIPILRVTVPTYKNGSYWVESNKREALTNIKIKGSWAV